MRIKGFNGVKYFLIFQSVASLVSVKCTGEMRYASNDKANISVGSRLYSFCSDPILASCSSLLMIFPGTNEKLSAR